MTALPTLPGAVPCRQVPADVSAVDLSDKEYTLPGPFSLPIHSADTKSLSATALAEEVAKLRAALEPFAQAGEVYRQAGLAQFTVALNAETESAGMTLRVRHFLAAADALK